MKQPHGAFAPVPTPLDSHGRFDPEAMGRHLDSLEREGLDGVLILGTNGEFPSFSLEERRAVARAGASTGMQRILGVGSTALPEVIDLTELAAELGYTAALCPPPWYFRSAPVEGLAEFFRSVLDAARLPVLLYHIPQVTGIPVSEALLDAIGPHSRLAGIKDSTGDPGELSRWASRFSSGYFAGSDRLVQASIEAGGGGTITAAASVVPGLVRAVHGGESAQKDLDAVRGLLEEFGLGPAVKAILRRRGLGAYDSRPPLRGLPAAREDELWARFESLLRRLEEGSG